MNPRRAAVKADALLSILASGVDRGYIGEPISQLEHALQCAAAADRAGADESSVFAALFHDVGHLAIEDGASMGGLGTADHETIGARVLLEAGCAAALADLVANHVAAKRYLCWREPAYFEKLSGASKRTLEWQGGPMEDAEARVFGARPNLAEILALRCRDEAAKDPGARVPGLEHYRARLAHQLEIAAC